MAILQDPATVRLMDPAEDLNERALPRPILAGERMHLSSVKTEIDVAQNFDGAEAFCDSAKLNDRRHFIQLRMRIVRITGLDDVPGFS